MMLPLGLSVAEGPPDDEQRPGHIIIQTYHRYRSPYAICHGK